MNLVRQVWSLFDGRRRQAAALLVIMILGAGFEALGVGLVMPFIALVAEPATAQTMPLMSGVISVLGIESEAGIIIFSGLVLLGVFLVKNAYLALMYYAKYRFVFDNQVRLSRRLFGAYLTSPYAFHLHRNSAELLRNVNDEVRMSFGHVVIPLLTLAVELSVVIVIGALLVVVEPVVAPITLIGFGLLSLGFYLHVRKKAAHFGREQQEHARRMIQWVQQGLGGIKEARVLGCEDYFLRRYHESSRGYARALRFHRVVKELPRNVVETFGLGAMILVVVLLVARGQDMAQVLPILGLFAVAAVRLLPSMTRIIAAATSVRHFRPAIEVIYRDLERLEKRGKTPKHRVTGGSEAADHLPLVFEKEVAFEEVQFSYPEAFRPALRDVQIRIRQGESVGFVGPSGAGKTTAVDLLLGLLQPEQGRVVVDGRDIREDLRSYQDQLGYIAQPTYLMDDTIRRNVAFGLDDDEIDEGQVWQSLRDAQLAELIGSMPAGLETMIGEGGVRISGGQRQRLGIARALYRSPKLLVLDEATSALDNATEQEINQAIEGLSGRVTLVIIAHRLSTVRHCDRLFFFREGRIVDSGSFQNLLARNRDFQQMVRASGPDVDGLSGAAQS